MQYVAEKAEVRKMYAAFTSLDIQFFEIPVKEKRKILSVKTLCAQFRNAPLDTLETAHNCQFSH